jgi:hypothetical protein
VRNAPRQHNLVIQAVPKGASYALAALAVVAACCLVLSLPVLAPENIFQTTQSRLQIPVDVLFHRLSTLRPNGTLTPRDTALRARFVNQESRLLYLQYGPFALSDCPFCTSDDPRSYLYYALADLVTPHLLNLVVLTAVTSELVTGREGSSWRTMATMAAVAMAVIDVYVVGSYKHQANARATRLVDLDCFYWTARVYRLVGLAALDSVLGWLLWLSTTNRAFVTPPTAPERIENVLRALGGAKAKLHAVGIVKNTAIRDEELHARSQAYWTHEVMLMRNVMEEKEVIDGVKDALENRINIEAITREAEIYAQSVLQPGMPPPGGSKENHKQKAT